jgi:putative transposase
LPDLLGYNFRANAIRPQAGDIQVGMNGHNKIKRDELKELNRRTLRIKGYDYSQAGAYFVTVCAYQRRILFKDVKIRKIVEDEWMNTALVRKDIILDEFVVMPNHVHGIIIIRYNDVISRRGELHSPHEFKSPSKTIGAVIRGFKASSYRKINLAINVSNCPIWQRNYYEHVIRNEADLFEKRKYIIDNPAKWNEDEYYADDKTAGH